ncbi:MAG TPA: hypothetical protein ENH94_02140 [Phycisphaerales bacterium]|nr:hypothetical protein [Phycisphaerales bacterium]
MISRKILFWFVLWPLWVYERMITFTLRIFRPGDGDPECKGMAKRYGRASRYRISFGDSSRTGRWRFIRKRIAGAGKRTHRRR